MAIAGFLIFNVADTPLSITRLRRARRHRRSASPPRQRLLAGAARCKPAAIARVSGYYYAASTFPAALSGFTFATLINAFNEHGRSHHDVAVALGADLNLAQLDTTQNYRQPPPHHPGAPRT
jgi:hypothetical protein